MPKIILNLERRIIDVAKKEILGKSEYNFSMRSIAEECNISVGTIYNYFPDKNVLIAQVMMDDWNKSFENIGNIVQNVKSLSEGIGGIYQEIMDFWNIYDYFWTKYKTVPTFLNEHNKRHAELIDQLYPNVKVLLERFLNENRDVIARMLMECIMNAITRSEITKEDLLTYVAFIEQGKD